MNLSEYKIQGNTIDFRGLEQIVSRKECEKFAATCGIQMMFYGYSNTPSDVDPDCKSKNGEVHEVFWSPQEHDLYISKGHKLVYPARQYCAICGGAMFDKRDSNRTCEEIKNG